MPSTPPKRDVSALLVAHIGVVVLFAAIYRLLGPSHVNCGTGTLSMVDALYFSFSISSTVGFGDFVAKTPLAKTVVMAQQAYVILATLPILRILLRVDA